MRVACPECEAQYEVPDRLIGTGRRLRCARCDHDWLVRAPAAAEPEEAPSPAPPEPSAANVESHREPAPTGRQAGLGLWLAWVASLGAVAAMLAALWLYRAPLAEAWPPLSRLL